MTILEPYGITFVDTLVAASFDGASQSFRNWTQLPYMLELNFHGYDDQGNPIADSNMALYRKRFPIVMTEIKVDVTTKGAEYRVKFAPAGGLAHFPENGCVDKPITVIAGTVAEFFDENNKDSFTYQLNSFFRSKVALGKASVADYIKFDIDPSIASSKITYDKVSGLAQSNPGGIGIDLTKLQNRRDLAYACQTQTQDQVVKLIKKAVKESALSELKVRDAAGHVHQLKKVAIRMANGKVEMKDPGKSGSSGGGGK